MTHDTELELYHHGVKGMKWGVRRKRPRYITVHQAKRNASEAAEKARKESLNADRAYNKNLRVERKTERKAKLEAKGTTAGRQAVKNALITGGVLTAVSLAAYSARHPDVIKKGVQSVKNSLLDKAFHDAILDANGNVIKRLNLKYIVN